MATEARVKELIAGNKIMVFSKSYCPFCTKAKKALSQFTSDYTVLEVRIHPLLVLRYSGIMFRPTFAYRGDFYVCILCSALQPALSRCVLPLLPHVVLTCFEPVFITRMLCVQLFPG